MKTIIKIFETNLFTYMLLVLYILNGISFILRKKYAIGAYWLIASVAQFILNMYG